MKTIITISIVAILTFACGRLDLGECTVACSEEFRVISVRVDLKGSLDNAPDSVLTLNTVLKKVYAFERNSEFFPVGFYPLITDGQFFDVDKDGTKLELIIYKGGAEKKRVEYVVGNDCCHVIKISGPEVISLD